MTGMRMSVNTTSTSPRPRRSSAALPLISVPTT